MEIIHLFHLIQINLVKPSLLTQDIQQIPEEETELLKALVKLIAFAKIISKEDSLPLSAAHVLGKRLLN